VIVVHIEPRHVFLLDHFAGTFAMPPSKFPTQSTPASALVPSPPASAKSCPEVATGIAGWSWSARIVACLIGKEGFCWKTQFGLWGLLGVVSLTLGCQRSIPVYFNEGQGISSYLDQSTRIDYPDVDVMSLDEVTLTRPPITVIDPDFDAFYDLTLEEAIAYGLHNAKIIRGYGTPALQNSRVLPGIDTLVNSPLAAGTMWNVAVRETEPGFIGTPGQIGNPGSIFTNTGLDVNQGVEAALADFDAQFVSSLNFVKSDEPRNTVPINPISPLIFQQDQVTWQSEVAKKTAGGTQIFFRNVNTYFDNNNPLASEGGLQILDSWYRTALEAEIRQPLMRGRGEFINRMPIVVSRIGTDQEIANLETQLQNYVTNIEIRYWDLYLAYRNLDAAKKGRNAALETWKIVKDQFDEGADVNAQQVAQAAQQFISFNIQVTEAFNQILNAQNQLRFLLGWSSSDGLILRPSDDPITTQIEFSWYESLCEALTYRPELRRERWEIKKRELALAYAKNGLLPELNATALYRWLGLGNRFGTSGNDTPFPDAGSAALNELFGGNYQELQFGVDFRMPVGYRRELANVRNAQLKLAQEIGRMEDMELDVSKELTEAFQALAVNQQIMQQSYDRWKYGVDERDHFELLRNEGVDRLEIALDAQQRLASAEIAFYTAMIEYNKIIALIHRRKGTVLAYSGIEFSEGPWSGKAYLDAQEHARRRAASRQMDYGWSRPQVISRGEQFISNQNVGYPISGSPEAEQTFQYPLEGSGPAAVEMLWEGFENELIPPAQNPSFELLPDPAGSSNQPTTAPRDDQSSRATPSAESLSTGRIRLVSFLEPAGHQQDSPTPSADSQSTVGFQPAQPNRNLPPVSAEPIQTARPLAAGQPTSEPPILSRKQSAKPLTAETAAGIEQERLQRLGFHRDTVEINGNLLKIQIRD
jgi:outer membrane protein TolC